MLAIDGYTRTCGLIGNPVEHTLSPVIHNTLAELTGQKLCYVPFHVETGRLEDAVKGAYALNLLGMNVTVPYKSEVIPFLKDIDPLAQKIGAVNTLVRIKAGYKGYNTDMPGLYRAMCAEVALLLAEKGAAEFLILNRTLDKAKQVAAEVNQLAGRALATAMANAEHTDLPEREKYLVIQATSVGMHPRDDEVVIEDEAFYERVHTGYDLIFNPAQTRFMKMVQAHGGRAYNGAKMLLYQGVIAYEYWTDTQIIKTPDRVKDELITFLGYAPALTYFDGDTPTQQGAVFELREHQEEALASLAKMREEGKTIALVQGATGSGKSAIGVP